MYIKVLEFVDRNYCEENNSLPYLFSIYLSVGIKPNYLHESNIDYNNNYKNISKLAMNFTWTTITLDYLLGHTKSSK